jgi:hypothetical protein
LGANVKVSRCVVAAGAVAAVLLAGCVTVNVPRVNPGSYPNYREMLVAQLELFPWDSDAPRDLVRRFNICGADVMLGYFTTYELERLDKYARGELHISEDELERISDDVDDRIGGEKELTEKIKQRCPDVIRDAEAHKKAHS